MAYFRSFFGGGGAETEEENGTEVVERLVERAETCTALEDRRDALRTLRSLARKYRVAVGSMSMNVLMEILDQERSNQELLALSLEILNGVLSNSDDDMTDEDDLGERFAEVMLKKEVFVPGVLAAVEQFDFGVRRASIQVLTSLLRHRGPEVQEAIMGQATGVSSLLDLVHDNREVVRNDVILMLCELSRSNSQMQQLLAYDNGFVLLLDIMDQELLDSIVIEDCLFVVLNLLRKNTMNQQLFRENNLIVRLTQVLYSFLHGTEDEPEGADWPKQRTANLIFLLQVIRSLVSPDNQGNNTHAAQKAMFQCKMLHELVGVLLSETGVSVEVLTESVIAVAEIIRGNYTNQEFFASNSLATPDSTRPALLVLLISMTAEKQPFKLRCAVFYAFLSYLHDNEFGKTKIIETLLSSQQNDSLSSTGGMLCQALTSVESVQCWFGSVSLMHCLLDCDHLREQLLRVQLATIMDKPLVSLLSYVSNTLVSYGNRRMQMRCGLLMLLGSWLTNCPTAVQAFISNQDYLHYLTTQIMDESGEGSESEQQVVRGLMTFVLLTCLHSAPDTTSRKSLEQLVERRVSRERAATCLEAVSRTEQFVRAAQRPQPLAKAPQELFLDFHFVRLFKAQENSLLKLLRASGEFNGTTANNDNIIQSFKELIKRQDEEISVLKQDMKRLTAENEQLNKQPLSNGLEEEVETLRKQLSQTVARNEQSEAQKVQIQEMYRANEQWRAEADKYKQWAEQWQQYQLAQLPNGVDVAIQQLQQQVQQLEQQLSYGYQAFEQHSQQAAQYASECASWRQRAEAVETKLTELEKERASSTAMINGHGPSDQNGNDELAKLQAEQEDLLVLLADQHNKMSQYRRRLKLVGQTVTDDEDDEDDDE